MITLVLLFPAESIAKGWREITPLRSTRQDVKRLLNQCADPTKECRFDLGNEHVRIIFSGTFPPDFQGCSDRISPGVVLLVEVTPLKPLMWKDLNINKARLRSFDGSSPPNMGYKGYVDEKEGVIIKTYKRSVLQIDYLAAWRDRGICTDYYRDPEAFIRVALFDDCPALVLTCPPTDPRAGQTITFSVDTVVDSNRTIRWTLTAGKIIHGQGTRNITVDTEGLDGRIITATVEVDGRCSGGASCQVKILSHRPNNF
jgi:hypothetical protein